MILPFLSGTWSAFSGQYAEPFVRVMCDVNDAGRFAAPFLNARKKGRKVVLFQNAETLGQLYRHPDDRLNGKHQGLWPANGIKATARTFGTVVEQLFAAKVDLDLAVFDMETGFTPWSMSADGLAAIYADPRYKALAATGRFPADCRNMNEATRTLFSYGCGFLTASAFQKAIIAPLYKRYNNLQWCNFGERPCRKEDAAYAMDENGHADYSDDSGAPVYSPVLYATVGQLGKIDARFKESFYVVAWMLNGIRVGYRVKPMARMMPWVSPRIMSNVLTQTYWSEMIYHTCCMTGTNQLYFNASDFTALSNWRYDNALSQFIGKSRGRTFKSVLTTDLLQYDSAKFVHSACKLDDGSVIGRVTFKPGTDAATFKVDGKTYTVKRPADGIGEWFHS